MSTVIVARRSAQWFFPLDVAVVVFLCDLLYFWGWLRVCCCCRHRESQRAVYTVNPLLLVVVIGFVHH